VLLWAQGIVCLHADDAWDVAPYASWRSALWSESPATFLAAAEPHGYRWNARRDRVWSDQPIRFGTLPIRHSELFFRDGVAIRWEWTVQDRARHGEVTKAWALAQLDNATNLVQQWAGAEPMEMAAEVGFRALAWGRPPHIVTILWNTASSASDGEAASLLRLVFEPWPPRRDWRANVKSADGGDRFLDGIPMVDQKVQGHCAPATVERVMRYFGIPLGASVMARLAESSADAGTNVERMMAKIEGFRGMRCDVREVFGFDVDRFDRTIRAYNREAARSHAAPLRWEPPVLDLARVFSAADAGTLRTAAARQPGKARFSRAVAKTVESGHPLLWGVILGIVAEDGIPAATAGGHLRLIVGYNAARGEILYSDSWGAGHELKRMPLDDAWSMTISLHVIAPPER
jgi:hypothetical protein